MFSRRRGIAAVVCRIFSVGWGRYFNPFFLLLPMPSDSASRPLPLSYSVAMNRLNTRIPLANIPVSYRVISS